MTNATTSMVRSVADALSPTNSSTTILAAGSSLTIEDKTTLRRALSVMTEARASLESQNPPEAALSKMASAFGYLVGYLDGKMMFTDVRLNVGYSSLIAEPAHSDLKSALDSFEAAVQSQLDAGETRITPVGVVVGAAIYAVGAYLCSA